MSIDIKPGDEIITTPLTWIYTAEVIKLLNAKPVFVDIDESTCNINANLISKKITKKTKAIIPVSIFGQCAELSKLEKIVESLKLKTQTLLKDIFSLILHHKMN